MALMRKLALDHTLTAGVAALGLDPSQALAAARDAADSVPAGQIGTAPADAPVLSDAR